jgi:hypothetical protein
MIPLVLGDYLVLPHNSFHGTISFRSGLAKKHVFLTANEMKGQQLQNLSSIFLPIESQILDKYGNKHVAEQ